MISICIPVYNVKVTPLVDMLLLQAKALHLPFEIILIDDHSKPEYRQENEKLEGPHLSYIELNENIGRARIRNMFIAAAKYEHLIFLDCDSKIPSSTFLNNYIKQIRAGERVVCGGRIYDDKPPGQNKMLHWKYGKVKESKDAEHRMKYPYRSFMTNNFMIEKKLLEEIKFDERIAGYGHEDTLFGYQLKKRNIPIKHIDNNVIHVQLEDNAEFLVKSENAISNLQKILEFVHNDPEFIEDVTLLKYYALLQKTGMLFMVRIPYTLFHPILKRLAQKGTINMFMFDIYKLGYLADN
jgi:glycosyltransferase involved in cell wall biosynthesis